MVNNQYQKTLWISYSGICDFEKCRRFYYLRNLYTTPVTERKIQVADPYLTLGTVVHRVTEELAVLPVEKRKEVQLRHRFERIWDFFSGKRGGFSDSSQENQFYKRGMEMIERLEASEILYTPSYSFGPNFPKVRLFKDLDIILVGNIDWVEILAQGTLHIIDFKTGQTKEDDDSLQLPIYLILGTYNFEKPVEKTSYWYLGQDEVPTEKKLNPSQFYIPIIQQKAIEIKKAIDENLLVCNSPEGSCRHCQPYEKILLNQAEYVGFDRKMNREIYFV